MKAEMAPKRLVVAITGASGTIYGVRMLEVLRDLGVETHLVVSPSGHLTRGYETELSKKQLEGLADVVYRPTDIAAAISSGSFITEGMVIAPCSMRTLAEIANGVSTSLVSRAADVILKERRRLSTANPRMAATIARQETDAATIRGLQLYGTTELLQAEAAESARATFAAAFPAVGIAPAPIWAFTPSEAKLVDNRLGFGHKELWPAS